jgi:hypothetical protein
MAVELKVPNDGAGELVEAPWLGTPSEDMAARRSDGPPNGLAMGWLEKGRRPFEVRWMPLELGGVRLNGLFEKGVDGAPKTLDGGFCNPLVDELSR